MTYEKWKPLTSLYGQNLQNNIILITIIYKSILSFFNCVFENTISVEVVLQKHYLT